MKTEYNIDYRLILDAETLVPLAGLYSSHGLNEAIFVYKWACQLKSPKVAMYERGLRQKVAKARQALWATQRPQASQ